MGGRETEPDASGRIGRRRFRDGAFRLGVTAALQSLELSGPGSNPGGGAGKNAAAFFLLRTVGHEHHVHKRSASLTRAPITFPATSHKEPPCQPLVSPSSSWPPGRALA